MGRWKHRGEEGRAHKLRERVVSRTVVVRQRVRDVVIYGPAWKTSGRKSRDGKSVLQFSAAPKNGDAAVVISYGDILELCNVLQEILAKAGKDDN